MEQGLRPTLRASGWFSLAKSAGVQTRQHWTILERRQDGTAWQCPGHFCLCLQDAHYPAVEITGGILTNSQGFYYSRK